MNFRSGVEIGRLNFSSGVEIRRLNFCSGVEIRRLNISSVNFSSAVEMIELQEWSRDRKIELQ